MISQANATPSGSFCLNQTCAASLVAKTFRCCGSPTFLRVFVYIQTFISSAQGIDIAGPAMCAAPPASPRPVGTNDGRRDCCVKDSDPSNEIVKPRKLIAATIRG